MSREELIATAVALGLLFEKNISNANLQKKIDEKNAKLEAQLKDTQNDDDVEDTENLNPLTNNESEDEKLFKEEMEALGKVETKVSGIFTDIENHLQKKIDENDNDDVTVQRVSSCGGYKTKIKGLKEAARRSGVSVEQIQEALETGNSVGGYLFTFIG